MKNLKRNNITEGNNTIKKQKTEPLEEAMDETSIFQDSFDSDNNNTSDDEDYEDDDDDDDDDEDDEDYEDDEDDEDDEEDEDDEDDEDDDEDILEDTSGDDRLLPNKIDEEKEER